MRLVLFAVVAFSVAASSARAAPTDAYTYDRQLGTIARETLWQAVSEDARVTRREVLRVYVRCYRDKGSFEQAFERRYGRSARRVVAYYAGGGDVHLRKETCAGVRAFFRGRHTVLTAGAYAILLHEALHRQGVAKERIATCLANDSVRWGAEWFRFGDAKALRARNLAFMYTRLYSHPSYRMGKPNCLALVRRSDWIDFR